MNSIVDAKAFSEALNKVSTVPVKSGIPILEEVRAAFGGGRCTLTATNLEQWAAAEVPARGDSFSFVFRRTKSVAKTCGYFDGELCLELTGEKDNLRLTMICGHRAGEFDVTPGADYPPMPEFTAEETYTLDAARLLARVNRVKYAADKSGDRPEFGGVRFLDRRVACVGGCRLATDTDESLAVQTPFIVPKKALEHLKLFGGGQITMSRNERHILFSGGGLIVLSRLLEDGGFQLDGCVPKTFHEEFSLSPKEFLRELEFLDQGLPSGCKRYVRFDRGGLRLYTTKTKRAARVEIDGESSIAFGFDLSYMAEAMKQFSGTAWVTLHIAGPMSPIVVTAEGRGDIAMVLPVRLRESAAA